jgi:predicted phage terminase large subunit-like protein
LPRTTREKLEALRTELGYRRRQARRPTLAQYVASSTGYTLDPWQHLLCARLEAVAHMPGSRLLIHAPPQHGKSVVVSQRFPAWVLGTAPATRIRIACYNVSHAERFAGTVQILLRDPAYAAAFPDPGCRLPAVAPRDEWSTAARSAARDANPSMKALGLGTGFTGLASDLLILDDPYKDAQEARSEAVNRLLWDWWQGVVVPRLHPASSIVVMFHRWWEGDFAGRLLGTPGWDAVRFPAIADGSADDPTGRELGEPLSPRYPISYLAEVRARQGTLFEAQYQGTPFPAEGSLFAAGRIGWVDAVPAGARYVRGWDLAASSGTGDSTAGVLLARTGSGADTRYYVADVVRGQWGTDRRNALIRQTAEADRARAITPQVFPQDPGQAGKDQAQGLVRLLGGMPARIHRITGDKPTRADPFSAQWNAGDGRDSCTVSLVRAPWNDAFLAEVLAFPQGRHDDQVDAASLAFAALAPAPRPVAPQGTTKVSLWRTVSAV